MCHFLAGEPGVGADHAGISAEEWNRRVDEFDTERFARRLAETGAGYFLMTVGQNTGHYCAPNAAYDSVVGILPSKCSQRDLIEGLHNSLAAVRIPLLAYLPSGAPLADPVAVAQLNWRRPGTPETAGCRQADFQSKWEAVIREWAERWGPKVLGWWIDGCYDCASMYGHADAPNFASFAAALQAGNPERILGFNPGPPRLPLRSVGPEEDYLGGHSMGLGALYASPGTRWVEHAQFHILEYLGEAWGLGGPRFPDRFLAEYIRHITDADGVVTLDVPIRAKGEIPDPFMRQLAAVGNALAPGRK